jgi:acyl-CoA synthetase (AMP-forming)/AMP-acid ligase II
MTALEDTFGVPVIESYGMTEAAHQMASNPLPPAPRFPGSVGIAAGPDIAIMDSDGTLLPADGVGEVVIRGPNVTAGYDNNPTANASAFHDGWFRTGDEGMLDADGYLRLTGRLKEIINRAGEKIAPLEIDNVLMEHPSVQQVVTFAMPSRVFGEDVAAAVVLREGETVDAEALRTFVAGRLAPFKVPRTIVFLPEIPKGATGKLQRIGLAQRLGVSD